MNKTLADLVEELCRKLKEENKMELMKQCQIWNENDEYQKIIDALEAIPSQERTPEMDS